MTITETPTTKTTVALSNFDLGNTPPIIEKGANIVLKVAMAGIVIGGILAAPPLSLAVGTQIILYSGVAGTMIKAVSKIFGITVKE